MDGGDAGGQSRHVSLQLGDIRFDLPDVGFGFGSQFSNVGFGLGSQFGDVGFGFGPQLSDFRSHFGDFRSHLGDLGSHFGYLRSHFGDLGFHLGDIRFGRDSLGDGAADRLDDGRCVRFFNARFPQGGRGSQCIEGGEFHVCSLPSCSACVLLTTSPFMVQRHG